MSNTLKALLEYQEVDLQLRAHEVEIEKSDAYRDGARARQNINKATERLRQCEKRAEEILNMTNKIQTEADAVSSKIEELKNDVKETGIDDDVVYIINILKRTQDMKNGLIRDSEDIEQKIAEVVKTYNEARDEIAQQKEIFHKSKKDYEDMLAEKKEAMDTLTTRLVSIAKNIAEAPMAKYSTLRRERKMPVIQAVLKDGTIYRCPSCRMEVDAATVDHIRNSEFGECATCRHILYTE